MVAIATSAGPSWRSTSISSRRTLSTRGWTSNPSPTVSPSFSFSRSLPFPFSRRSALALNATGKLSGLIRPGVARGLRSTPCRASLPKNFWRCSEVELA